MDYRKVAEEVIEAIGGKDNVDSAAHCATRLRLVLKDEEKSNKERAERTLGKIVGDAHYENGYVIATLQLNKVGSIMVTDYNTIGLSLGITSESYTIISEGAEILITRNINEIHHLAMLPEANGAAGNGVGIPLDNLTDAEIEKMSAIMHS
jgi:hypothetical protein